MAFSLLFPLLISYALATILLAEADVSLTDCSCITGWDSTDLDCNPATIELLHDFLTLPSINCIENCENNFECQQAFSLLSQYYDYCPLSTFNDTIIKSFWQYTSCIDCKQVASNNPTNPECEIINNCTQMSLSISNNYFSTNCSTDCITDACDNNLLNISSFLRQCKRNIVDLDDDILYALFSDECKNINYDCNINYSGSTDTDCSFAGKLDLISIKKQTMMCFYGLNIENPTIYDLICVEKQDLNRSGIISYSEIDSEINSIFWSSFGIALDFNQLWILLCGALVFFMQLGFTLLEAGHVKSGNVQNILFKNIMDACIGSIVFYLFGYCVAYGAADSENTNGFIGVEDILIESADYNLWFFQWAFAATAATIVSGAVAERCGIESYFIYTIVISSWIYPIVAHWTWSSSGWISPFNPQPQMYGGAIDFAGSAVVHMVGGFSGLMGAYWLGPRFRRFDKSESATGSRYHDTLMHTFEFGHNVPFQVLGTLILWFGWYGFNCGSTLAANGAMNLASKVAVTTTLSAATGGLCACFLARVFQKKWHIPRICNGILAGLVSLNASCSVVSPGIAIFIGLIGGVVYYIASNVLEKVEIDDPLDAFAVHGCCGIWGVLSVGIFGTDENIKFSLYPELLWKDTSHAQRFATQIVLILSVAAWTIVNAGILFATLKFLNILRVEEEYERSGIDAFEHGGSAVNMNTTYTQIKSRSVSVDDENAVLSPKTPMAQITEENATDTVYPL